MNEIERECLEQMRVKWLAVESLRDGVDDPGFARQVECPACMSPVDGQCWNEFGNMGNQVHTSRVSAASPPKAGEQPQHPEAPS
jgi:hypothetical protein